MKTLPGRQCCGNLCGQGHTTTCQSCGSCGSRLLQHLLALRLQHIIWAKPLSGKKGKMSGMLQLIVPCHFWVPRSETDSTPSLNSGLLAESCTWHYTLMPFGISCAQRCARGTWHFDLMPFQGILCSEVQQGHLALWIDAFWHLVLRGAQRALGTCICF